MAEGYAQIAPDSTGKLIDLSAIVFPAGTVFRAADGTLSTLTADTTYYRQNIVIADPSNPSALAAVSGGEADRGALNVENRSIAILESIDETLQEIASYLKMALQG